MEARIVRTFSKDPKDDEKTHALRYSFPEDNPDGFSEGTVYIIADSSEEASRAAKDFIVKSNKRRKRSKISEAILEDCRCNQIFYLKAEDIARLG